MLYLLLKEEEAYLSAIDQGHSYWKYFSQFEAASREEALNVIPNDRYGKYRLYEIHSEPSEYLVRQKHDYELTQVI